ncbi:uncharacterized protein EAF01_000128 [Botrytis porri]|uniref:uncharacterized protein n=1 Tax=Botrytis porri TaxID=87229 RepID=UPI001902B345|nr:uncharacterized protein EAF01_000128 [Botrytis porri]KAF7913722.1 hypothetical protein EAF01_000128 [Botrytis porri]
MNFATIIPIPKHGSLQWPRASDLMLRQDEVAVYDSKHSLHVNIQNHRGTQTWKNVDASRYIPLPNTHKYTSVMALQMAASRCRSAMIELIRIHNERAKAHNRELQASQQNADGDDDDDAEKNKEEEEEVALKAELTSIFAAVRATLAREAVSPENHAYIVPSITNVL